MTSDSQFERLMALAASKPQKVGRRSNQPVSTAHPQENDTYKPKDHLPGRVVRVRGVKPRMAAVDDKGNPNQYCDLKENVRVRERDDYAHIERVQVEVGDRA